MARLVRPGFIKAPNSAANLSPVGERIVDRLADQFLRLILGRPWLQVNPRLDLEIKRELVGPAHEEPRSVVEIPLNEP